MHGYYLVGYSREVKGYLPVALRVSRDQNDHRHRRMYGALAVGFTSLDTTHICIILRFPSLQNANVDVRMIWPWEYLPRPIENTYLLNDGMIVSCGFLVRIGLCKIFCTPSQNQLQSTTVDGRISPQRTHVFLQKPSS